MTREEAAQICKAMSDTNRLRIIEMLTEGEKCGCMLLEELMSIAYSMYLKYGFEIGSIVCSSRKSYNVGDKAAERRPYGRRIYGYTLETERRFE